MDFEYSPKVKDLQSRITAFLDEHVYPAERVFAEEVRANRAAGNPWVATKIVEELKEKGKAAGLWNLFLPESSRGAGLTNLVDGGAGGDLRRRYGPATCARHRADGHAHPRS